MLLKFKASGILILAIILTGCPGPTPCVVGTKITIPSTDTTPPTVTMDAHMPSGSIITVNATSPATSSIGGGDKITLISSGSDPEGIHDIQIWVQETWWYTDPATGTTQQQGPGLLGAPESSNPDNTTAGGPGCSSRLTTVNLDINTRRKGATQYQIVAWATAINFGGATVKTANLTFNYP